MLKQDVINAINTLPDDIAIADVMYRLYVMGKHEKALADIDADQTLSTGEVREGLVKYQ